MRKARFGPTRASVPVVGIGTWNMESDDHDAAVRALRRAIDHGMTHIDTAELYGNGAVEEIVADAIAGYRGEVFLASKVRPEHATYTGTLLACEKSLRRLRTDHLDLYMLHWRGTYPLSETFRAFEALVKEGKIRAWGVSNFDIADLEDAFALVGQGVIACDQVLYHLRERDAEHVLQGFCARHDIPLVAYSPLGAGDFPANDPTLARVAAKHGVSTRAVALAFLARGGAFVIPKSSNPDHVDALAKGDIVLDAGDVAAIDHAFTLEAPKSSLPTL